MVIHVLNGDALFERFTETGLEGEIIVAREALISGPCDAHTLAEFYQKRAAYISHSSGETGSTYFARVVTEFDRLLSAPENSIYNLWFGYDLFCRVNMWFVLSLLHDLPKKKQVYIVYPSYLEKSEIWKDFGPATVNDLVTSYNNRLDLNDEEIKLGKDLWLAFKKGDLELLEHLSRHHSACFPYLQEVCVAHIERFPKDGEKGRPERVVEEIMRNSKGDFNHVFEAFFKKEGIYGFGDVQLREIYDHVLQAD